jgi:hypothetical protein
MAPEQTSPDEHWLSLQHTLSAACLHALLTQTPLPQSASVVQQNAHCKSTCQTSFTHVAV